MTRCLRMDVDCGMCDLAVWPQQDSPSPRPRIFETVELRRGARALAPRFLQTPPRDDALALHYAFSSIRVGRAPPK